MWNPWSRPQPEAITPADRFTPRPYVIATARGRETLLLDPVRSVFFSTGYIGGLIWSLLPERLSVREVVRHLCKQCEVEEDVAERDVIDFMKALREAELIEPAGTARDA